MKNRLLEALAIALLLALPATAHAAPPPKPVGVTISPAYQQVTVGADQQQQPVTFQITNNEQTAMALDLSVRDFNTLGESGGLFFVGTNPTQLQQKYRLAKWFSLPQQTITLEPGQTQTIQGEVLNQGDFSPGGHYGALLLTADSSSGSPAKNKVTITPIASSLMFVTKTGGDTHSLDLAGVNYKHSVFSLPSAVTLRFKNAGNTHVVPRGVVTITNSSGRMVAKGVINEDSNIILPESYRQVYVPLTKIGGANSIGQYQLKVDFRFDGFDQYREYRTSFEYVPKALLILLIIALGAAAAILARRRPKRRKK